MAFVIKNRQVAADSWQLHKPDSDATPAPASGDVIVPLPMWLAQRESLLKREGRVGVWLDSHEEPGLLAADTGVLPLIAVNFPAFGDGRGFSIARLLRERYGYKGELRAIGAVVRDHLYAMAQCGFDAFQMRDGEQPEEALTAFTDFSDGYQTSVLRTSPLFKRRVSGEVTRA